MKTIKSNANEIVTLQYLGEDIVIDPANPIRLIEEQADFVLKTLGFCEVIEDVVKKEVSVPAVPKVKVEKKVETKTETKKVKEVVAEAKEEVATEEVK